MRDCAKIKSRAGGIWTRGLFVPNEARYQTALQPDVNCVHSSYEYMMQLHAVIAHETLQ